MRLDVFLTEGGYVSSRARAKVLIEKGFVTVDGKRADKPSQPISEGEHDVLVQDDLPYVSRGGLKLEGALRAFGVDVVGKTALDIGASTGGFTDCLLQHGAASVCAVDAGVGQLAPSIAADTRVSSYEHLNARTLQLDDVGGERFDIIVMDVSFISATYILSRFPELLCEGGAAIILIKPQFEVGKAYLGKGGIVRDRSAHLLAVRRVADAVRACGMTPIGLLPSPIEGGDGNREFLLLLCNRAEDSNGLTDQAVFQVLGFRK